MRSGAADLPKYPASYTIPEGVTLTIPDARSLNIPEGVTLTNHGTITGDGRLEGVGTLTGDGVVTVSLNLFYDLVEYTVTVETEGQGTASASPASAAMGETVTLTADAAQRLLFQRMGGRCRRCYHERRPVYHAGGKCGRKSGV